MKKNILLSLFLVVALSIAVFFILQKPGFYYQDVPYYGDLWIENIRLDGKETAYSLKSGKVFRGNEELNRWYQQGERNRVLRLALFFQWAKEDPLLSDPNLDAEAFGEAVGYMEEPNAKLDAMTGWGYANPIAFLREFLETSVVCREFEQNISEESAGRFLSAMEKAGQAYAEEAERLGNVFSQALAKGEGSSEVLYLAGDTGVNLKVVDGDFRKIKENGTAIRKEIEGRRRCLKSFVCKRPLLDMEKPKADFVPSEPDASLFLGFEEMYGYQNDNSQGPFEIHSPCWKDRELSYLYSAANCAYVPGKCLDWPFLSDGDYFTKLRDSGGEGELKKQGVEVKSQSASAPYGCNDLTYKPKLRTMGLALDSYKNDRLFEEGRETVANADLFNLWNEGKKAESDFFDSKYPSDTAFENLANFYLYAYAYLSKNNELDRQQRQKFLQRANVMRAKLGGFDLVLNRSAFHFKSFLDVHASEQYFRGSKQEYMFLNRSDYSITFLGFSPVVWRLPDNLQYVIPRENRRQNPMPKEERPALSRETAIRVFGEEKIRTWGELIRKSREVSAQ